MSAEPNNKRALAYMALGAMLAVLVSSPAKADYLTPSPMNRPGSMMNNYHDSRGGTWHQQGPKVLNNFTLDGPNGRRANCSIILNTTHCSEY